MKYIYFLTAFLLLSPLYGQKIRTMNKGRAAAKNYAVTIPYKDIRGLAITEVIINGKIYTFMVDTGAVTAISPQLYEELQLSSAANLEITDSGNLARSMKVVTMPDISVGGLVFKDIPAAVTGESPFFQCLGIDGFLGSNLMRNSIVKFSHKSKTITFTDKHEEFDLDKKKGFDLGLDKMQSNPHLGAVFNSGDKKINETLLFDSGMTGFYETSLNGYINKIKGSNIFTVLNEAEGSLSLGINGVAPNSMQYRLLLPDMKLAGATFKNVTVNTTDSNNSRIGAELLHYGDVIIDYPGKKFYFRPYSIGEIDMGEKNWPVQPVIKDGKFVIGIVWDPAFNEEILLGDEILSFGEIDYESITVCDAFTTVLRPKDDIALIRLKDVNTGEIKEVELVRR